MTLTQKCPNCNKAIDTSSNNKTRPFCSDRCRLVDLSQWVDESYRIAGKPAPTRSYDDEGY